MINIKILFFFSILFRMIKGYLIRCLTNFSQTNNIINEHIHFFNPKIENSRVDFAKFIIAR
jgi:hypothetical protein